MANRRFRKTEEAILKVISDENYYIGTDMMAKKAGIARSTFYHHHRTVRHVLPDYEQYLMRKYSRLVGRLLRNKKLQVRVMYMNMLIFMIQNKKIVEILVRYNRATIIDDMIKRMREKLIKTMRIPEKEDKIFMVYSGEIATLICEWVNTGMDVEKIDEVLSDILYLTGTARDRLAPMRSN